MLTPLSEQLFKEYQVRKTKAQKTAFITFLQSKIPGLQVESGGFGSNRNLVLGDVKSAKVILTAHYDTCARMCIPNFITPKNFLIYILYNILVAIPFILIILALNLLWAQVTDNFFIAYWGSFLPGMALMFWVLMGGKPNPNTANDNTSGVIMLCQLIEALTDEQKSQVAFVFFDNEENGLLGSAFFRKLHKKDGLKDKLLINFDCVSDGDHIMLVQNKSAIQHYGEALNTAFPSTEEKTVYLENSANTLYPSDQANFPMNVGVAALKKHKLIGLYMDRIHTAKDTVFDIRNIDYLTDGTQRLLDNIL